MDAGVLDGAAQAAVGQVKPFFDLAAVVVDGERLLDVGGCGVESPGSVSNITAL